MASQEEIQERIDLYTEKIQLYSNNQKYTQRKEITEKLLNFWQNQLIKTKKINGKSRIKSI